MRRNRLVALATASLVGAAVLPLTAGSVGAAPAPATAPGLAASDATSVAATTCPPPPGSRSTTPSSRRRSSSGSRPVAPARPRRSRRASTAGSPPPARRRSSSCSPSSGTSTHPAVPRRPGAEQRHRPSTARCTTTSRSRTARRTTRRCGRTTTTASHFENMYFKRMRKFYERESNGKFSIDGAVTEWVKVPFNEARYGRDTMTASPATTPWFLVRDALAYWVDSKLASGWTMDKVRNYLKTFDELDRYDFDEDGNFKEPDGFIDHFQLVHAGGDESDGDPVYGDRRHLGPQGHAQVQPPGTGPEGGAQIGGVNAGEGGASGGGIVNVPEQPDRRVGQRLHRPARERRPRRVRARVRPRPRPAGPLRHLRQLRRRREQRRLLVPDGAVARHPAAATPASATGPRRWAPGRSSRWAGSTTRSPGPAARPRTRSGRTSPRTPRPSTTVRSCCCLTSRSRPSSARRATSAARGTSTATRATTSTTP